MVIMVRWNFYGLLFFGMASGAPGGAGALELSCQGCHGFFQLLIADLDFLVAPDAGIVKG